MRPASPGSYLQDPKIAAYAIGPEPAWLWSADGTRVLWANAAGASVFGAVTVAALASRKFEAADRAAQQIARMAESLTGDGAARLEHFSGFGSGLLRPLTCICSRLPLEGEAAAVLVCGVEPLRPALPLVDRLQRLLVDIPDALAAFTAEGELVFATASARAKLPEPNSLAALGTADLASRALREGTAAGRGVAGDMSLWRIGRQNDMLAMLRFDEPRDIVADPQSPDNAPTPEPVVDPRRGRDPAINISRAVSMAKSRGISATRRHPLRFVWQMDTAQHFTLVSDEFLDIASAATAQHNGAPWPELCAALDLDPSGSVAQAVATRDTWSGIILSWPTCAGDRVTVELAGLPIFDRQREFAGYRGFGVCRDTAQLDRLFQRRREEAALPAGADASIKETSIEEPPLLAEAAPAPGPITPAPDAVSPVANVVPFPSATPAESRTSAARASEPRAPGLTAGDRKAFSDIAEQLAARLNNNTGGGVSAEEVASTPAPLQASDEHGRIDGRAAPPEDGNGAMQHAAQPAQHELFDRLPLGLLIYRSQEMLYANPAFLERVGHPALSDFRAAGGLDALLLTPGTEPHRDPQARRLTIESLEGTASEFDAWVIPVPYDGAPASALLLDNRPRPDEPRAPARTSIRDYGHDRALDRILEQQLSDARRRAEQTAADHVAFLGNLSRDIRTPLTAIVGFAESILGERFGPIGNERYRDYLGGIRSAGSRILALIEHIGDAAVPDARKGVRPENDAIAESPAPVDLNQIVQSCVTELQPDAAHGRVLLRTSLTRPLPAVAADAKAVRQIVQNLMTNSIKLAGAGGQVIVSTGVNVAGHVSLRLRDTGIGLNAADLAASAQPPAAQPQATDGPEGRLKIAVAKALAEANRASLTISSRPNDGTLVEVSFSDLSAPAA